MQVGIWLFNYMFFFIFKFCTKKDALGKQTNAKIENYKTQIIFLFADRGSQSSRMAWKELGRRQSEEAAHRFWRLEAQA